MAELSLILFMAFAALATAGWVSRWLTRLSPGDEEDHRLKRAVGSAADAISRRQLRQLLWTFVVVVVGGAVLSGVFSKPSLFWLAAGGSMGAVLCWILGQVAFSFSLNGSAAGSRMIAASDSALIVTMRTACTVVLLGNTVAVVCGAGLLLFAQQGGLTTYPTECFAFVGGAVSGSLFTSLYTLFTGGALRVAGVVSRRCTPASAKQPFYWVDVHNPSLILDLVASHAGAPQARAQAVFYVSILLQLIAVALPLRSTDTGLTFGAAELATATNLLATLLTIQASTLLGASAIQLTLRAQDGARSWVPALGYGLLCTGVLALFVIAGAVNWLLPEGLRSVALVSATSGVVLALGQTAWSSRNVAGRTRRLEEPASHTRRSTLDLAAGLQAALLQTPFYLAILAAGLLVPWYLGNDLATAVQSIFWVTVGLASLLPFFTAQSLLEPQLDATSSLGALRQDPGRQEPHAHLSALCAVAAHAGSSAGRYACVASGYLAAVCIACASLRASAVQTPSTTPEWLLHGVSALAGSAAVLLALGLCVRKAVSTSQAGLSDVLRHLRVAASSDNSTPAPSKPGYANYLETTTNLALRQASLVSAMIVLGLAATFSAVSLIPTPMPGQLLDRQTSFLAFYAGTGISVALLGVGVYSFVGAARGFRRLSPTSPDAASGAAALMTATSSVTELLTTTVAPVALVLVNLVSALSITLTAFIY